MAEKKAKTAPTEAAPVAEVAEAAPVAPVEPTPPTNLGTLDEQPTVARESVKTELPDGTVRVDY